MFGEGAFAFIENLINRQQSPSKIGKLTLYAKIFTDVQILEDRCSVPM